MKNIKKQEKLYVSVYFDKLLDYVSFNKYNQQYVHLVEITDCPNDHSDHHNRSDTTSEKESGPIAWSSLPTFLRARWHRTDCIEVENAEGLREFLEESVILAFQTPKILFNIVDQTCAYALNANDVEIEPEDVEEHFGHLICFDELDLLNLSAAFLNGDRRRADDLSEFMDKVFYDYLNATVERAVFDFGFHHPVVIGSA